MCDIWATTPMGMINDQGMGVCVAGEGEQNRKVYTRIRSGQKFGSWALDGVVLRPKI